MGRIKRKTNKKKKYSSSKRRDSDSVITLAYFHRYGWIVVMLGLRFLFSDERYYVLFVSVIIYSIWTFVGYLCKWKHIFCSYQNAYHVKMTPNSVDWDWVDKKDAYGIPLFFMLCGLGGLLLTSL